VSSWLPTSPCTPAACIPPAPAPAALLRVLGRVAALVAVLCAGIVLSPLAARCAPGRHAALVRLWCRALVRSLGVRIRVGGALPPDGGVLIVSNHISWLDIPLLAAVRPARMLAKSDVRTWPVAGALAVRGRTLFIDRHRPRALPGTIARIAAALRDGSAVTAFPEGSTWCGRSQGSFRRAVFQAALDAGVPVQPVRVRYAHGFGLQSTAPAFIGDDTLVSSLWRIAASRDLVAEVRLSPLLAVGSHPDRRSLARVAQATAQAPEPAPRGPQPQGSLAGQGTVREPGGTGPRHPAGGDRGPGPARLPVGTTDRRP
jgi:1-acyl-sn-glycerol-3-phosphate acyltransferase